MGKSRARRSMRRLPRVEGLLRFPMTSRLVALTFLIGTLVLAALTPMAKATARVNKVINKVGEYSSPDGECRATLKIASMGGFLILTAGQSAKRDLKVDDVTGMAWVGGHSLVYTTSPIYGVPGVYVYRCDSSKAKRIVAPRTLTGAYPDGADFFELDRISKRKPFTAYFYYAPDVDNVNFTKFKTPSHLFQVHLDGTNLRKAKSP